MMTRSMRIFLLCLAAAAMGFAQNAANLPWWTSDVVHDLGLTPAQTQQIHQIVRAYRDRLFDARNNVQKAEAALEDFLNDPETNLAAAKPVIDRLAGARANSTRVFTEMSIQLRSVLTIDQWRELRKRWSEVQKTRKGDTQLPP
ncbi:MAG TPA: periplasmic heavy metal sensor [Bryobacteraceae bacterium]|jgi:Spy/CpxP family protein refolding chaperone|nr:periplasmic heavy metal sensor [Bryobacteraceae bacterium]